MANNGAGQKTEAYEKYLPVNKAYRDLTDDHRGRIKKLTRAMKQHSAGEFTLITAQEWGRIAVTLKVTNEDGVIHQFSIGKSIEGFVCFAENDNPLEMLPVSEADIPRIADILERLNQCIDYQLAQLVDKPEFSF